VAPTINPRVVVGNFGCFIDGRFYLTHNAGLFSCLSVTLFELARFGGHVTAVDAAHGLASYKDRSDDDLWKTLFLSARGRIASSDYESNPFSKQLWHHADYGRLDLGRAAPFLREYFSPGPLVEATVERLVRVHGITPGETIGLWYRGTDKSKEIDAVPIERFERSVRELLDREPTLRVLVQTDQKQVRDRLLCGFPRSAFFLDELPVTDGEQGLHKLGASVGAEAAITLLAVNLLMSRCRWVVTHTGNIALWTMLMRGHTTNCIQLYQALPAIKKSHRAA
jgi:hypothetical protein